MLKKFLATVSAAAMLAGAAHAVGLENYESQGDSDEPYALASALDYAGGAVTGTLDVGFGPSAGAFPTGNVLIFVTITGATFDGVLDGTEVNGTTTSVISTGGANGGQSVTFLVSGANNCLTAAPAGGYNTSCSLSLPVELTGSDVTISVGLETDAGADVDNSNRNNRVSATIVDIVPAFDVDIVADTTPTIADLNAVGGPFTGFTGGSDNILGTVAVAANQINYGSGLVTVNTDFGVDPVVPADVGAIDLLLSGSMDAFEGGDVLFNAASFDLIDAATREAEYDAGSVLFAATNISVVPDGTTAIARSAYNLSVVVTPSLASDLTAGTSASGALQSIERNGTQITFPWTQSATQGAASGASSVFRIGNLDNVPAGAVFVEVKNASEAGYTNPGIVQLSTSVPASGELVQNSAQIEGAVGNYGRGDLEFTVEADPDTLTARQFVVRNGVIQQVIGGNVQQDLN